MENQRAFLDSIGAKIGVKGNDLSPWYKVDQSTLIKYGCRSLMVSYYESSHYAMLKEVYPEFDWMPWKFKRIPSNMAIDDEILVKALSHIEKVKAIKSSEGWYRVSSNDLKKIGVLSLLKQAGGLPQTLRRSNFSQTFFHPSFPHPQTLLRLRRDVAWDISLFKSGVSEGMNE